MSNSQTLEPTFVAELIGGLNGGPSPFGLSYYSRWLECPKKARLNEEYKLLQAEDEEEAPEPVRQFDAKGKPKLTMSHVGIHGHALFEQCWKQKLGAEIALDIQDQTPELVEAVRLYNNFNAEWGSLEAYLGMQITEAEGKLGERPDVAQAVIADLGGPLTGRLDAAGTLFDVERAAQNTGHHLMPGRWIVDYKFGKAHKKSDPIKYPQDLQGAAYCYLDQLHNPENPCHGVLFIRIIGHKEMTKDSYVTYVCHRKDTDRDRLAALVRLGLMAKAYGGSNPKACVNEQWGDVCFFKTQRICPGF